MAGKSTYIRQIALLSLLAHVGSFVPAEFASFRLVDRLFTRIGTCDEMESNMSTFMREMVEISHILHVILLDMLVVVFFCLIEFVLFHKTLECYR